MRDGSVAAYESLSWTDSKMRVTFCLSPARVRICSLTVLSRAIDPDHSAGFCCLCSSCKSAH